MPVIFSQINMAHIFEELDYQQTPLGEISLRRRSEPRLDNKIIYEIKMNEEFLMSSLFVEAEEQLSKLGLAALETVFKGEKLDVVVGGLGLGYTASAALQNPALQSLVVIDVMEPVINWHQKGLVPLGKELMTDSRCELVLGDFFALATSNTDGFDILNADGVVNNKKVHAVLLDIDHSPEFWLAPENSTFYTGQGLRSLADKILSGGIFGLWSDEAPDSKFMELLGDTFATCESHIVRFANPYTQQESTNTVYLARNA